MADAPFRPFETALDEGTALAVLRAATAGADDGELFLERRRSEAIVLDDGRIKTASYDASEGFGLRAVRGEVAGYAHSTEISERALRRAAETARLAVGDGGGTLADAPKGTNFSRRSTPMPARSIRASCKSRPPCLPGCKKWKSCVPKACALPISARWRG
jgi:PmbA/TldA metallopeptidase domain 1